MTPPRRIRAGHSRARRRPANWIRAGSACLPVRRWAGCSGWCARRGPSPVSMRTSPRSCLSTCERGRLFALPASLPARAFGRQAGTSRRSAHVRSRAGIARRSSVIRPERPTGGGRPAPPDLRRARSEQRVAGQVAAEDVASLRFGAPASPPAGDDHASCVSRGRAPGMPGACPAPSSSSKASELRASGADLPGTSRRAPSGRSEGAPA